MSSEQNSGRGDDADNLLEDLLSKHGEVVYNAGGAPGIDADDDAECLSCMLPLHSSLFLTPVCLCLANLETEQICSRITDKNPENIIHECILLKLSSYQKNQIECPACYMC